MTFNIRHGLGIDQHQDLNRILEQIALQSPEIVALQEVDVRLPRSEWTDQAKWLGERMQMESIFGETLSMSMGSFGIALLSKYPIVNSNFHPLPALGEPRSVLQAEVETPEGRGNFLCTHFGLDREERLMQAGALLEIVRQVGEPAVILGDFNARPESRTMKLITQSHLGLRSCSSENLCTYPADNPSTQADYILITKNIRTVYCQVVETDASDHFPLVADIYLA